MLETQLHFISAIVILLAAIVSIYLTVRLKGDLRKLSAILSIFIFIHSFYHIFEFFGSTQLGEGFFEPLSVAVLIFFGVVYSNIARPKKQNVLCCMIYYVVGIAYLTNLHLAYQQ